MGKAGHDFCAFPLCRPLWARAAKGFRSAEILSEAEGVAVA
jgi:hypothetical protein